jgi:hypothetical protein
VTGGAGAITAARVFEVDVIAKQNIENRAGPAVVMERRIGRIEFYDPLGLSTFEDNAKFGHVLTQWISFRGATRGSSEYLQIRLIFAMMTMPPT